MRRWTGFNPSRTSGRARDMITLRLENNRVVQILRRAIAELRGLTDKHCRALRPDNAGVTLSQVLPDAFNLGYQEYRYLVLDSVNDVKVTRLADIKRALEKPIDGYHILKFQKGDSLQKVVLDASDEPKATERVLSRYGIENDHYFVAP